MKLTKIDDEIKSHFLENNLIYFPEKFDFNKRKKISNDIKLKLNSYFKDDNFKKKENQSKYLKNIDEKGYFKFEKNVLNEYQLKEIHTFLKDKNAYPAHVPCYDKDHPTRIDNFNGFIASYDAKTIIETPHLIELATDPKILNIVKDYLGFTPAIFDLNLVWSIGNRAKHYTDHFHRDYDDFSHCLLMVYLSDVDDECGGHIYKVGSHKKDLPPSMFNSEKILGSAGTAFVTDATGWHSGSVPIKGKKRCIFWCRYGLTYNYMWEVHNHRYWGYDNKLFEKKIKDKGDLAQKVSRFFTEDYDKEYFKNKKTVADDPVNKATINGWNLVSYKKFVFGIDQKLGDVDLRNYIDKDGLDKLKKMGVIISNNDKEVINKLKKIRNFNFIKSIIAFIKKLIIK